MSRYCGACRARAACSPALLAPCRRGASAAPIPTQRDANLPGGSTGSRTRTSCLDPDMGLTSGTPARTTEENTHGRIASMSVRAAGLRRAVPKGSRARPAGTHETGADRSQARCGPTERRAGPKKLRTKRACKRAARSAGCFVQRCSTVPVIPSCGRRPRGAVERVAAQGVPSPSWDWAPSHSQRRRRAAT